MSVRSRFEKATITPDPAAPAPAVLPEDPDKLLERQQAEAAAAAAAANEGGVETPVVVEEIPPTPVVPPAPTAPVEKRYEYQPTDESGRPLGGKQVIVYTTEQELAEKLRDQNIQLVRKLREVTRKQKLGIDDTPKAPDGQIFDSAVDLQEKPLTTEQVFELTQKLNDPTTFVEARDQLLESALGCSPAEFRKRYNEQQQLTLQLLVKSNYDIFEKTHSKDFDPSTENKQTMTDWMSKKGLAPTVANFEFALSQLKESGLILEAPTVREVAPPAPAPPVAPAPVAEVPPAPPAPVVTEPKPVVPASNESRIAPPVPPAAVRQPVRVPSGLNNASSSPAGPASVRTSLTVAEFERIPADELKRKLKDPVFAAQVNELFKPKPREPQI